MSCKLAQTATAQASAEILPAALDLMPISRRPCRLSDATLRIAESLAMPSVSRQASGPARASVIIVTHNQLPFTRLCLHTLLTEADAAGYRLNVIVVDNGSTDRTPAFLVELEKHRTDVRAILNSTNRGFAAANNQGLAVASSDLLVLLNNDTLVPPGWLESLERHTTDGRVGLVGPVTNRTCNEAQVETHYRTWGGFVEAARRRACEMSGRAFDIPMAAMYCVALRRDVYARLGPLDEQFGIGMFEDDDYSARARAAGLRVVCAEDVLIHHFGEASFGALVPDGRYAALLADNRRRFEAKWGVTWTPHHRHASESYGAMAEQLRAIVSREIPVGSDVFVVSRGDEQLLRFAGGHNAHHFPQDLNGSYAYQYPADDDGAAALLSRCSGGYLVFPATAFWWFDAYPGLGAQLGDLAKPAWKDESCRIYRFH